ncbi:hypothetical protein PHLGIDRAFT_110018 [Phlebiopsis gigantea 11061_1 CR5-6]|uniref:T6SS Phospholipase effector Tle1-like catalytic domain-containing protein n=1 Tax=Phlebiopsis gigantea (strain 11061_1 CR5-6) TaxID=745531 RepID=A0A0C3S2Z7_PHLG1|nr:hypothetical protein PHLGIDRAFT_110018 [Phlebiopsis gigantea 11061_1 CR5-6]
MAAPQPTSTDLPPIIPPPHPDRRRTLVLCFDGTGDQFDADNSNVIQLFTMLQKDDHSQQMVYYQAGIGTYTIPQIATPLWSNFSKTVDAAIAWNMHSHVMEGYRFLMENYQAGDKICLFGFSRGSYTARSLAGMLHKVGLLPSGNTQQVPFAYKMYTQCDETGWQQSAAFKKAFSINVDIEFVGVWDTVCSVGLIPRRLPFVSSNTAIRYFRHGVSLDERRSKFKANLYNRPTEDETKLGVQPGEMPSPQPISAANKDLTMATHALAKYMHIAGSGLGSAVPTLPKVVAPVANVVPTLAKAAVNKGKGVAAYTNGRTEEEEDDDDYKYDAQYFAEPEQKETDVLEVWFSGCHCDVGGGSVPNDTRHNLARIPLRWMIRQCFLANTGIRFHTQLLHNAGLDPASLYPISPPPRALPLTLRKTTQTRLTALPAGALSEEEEDLADLLCPIYDQLALAPGWWVLEVLPMTQRFQAKDNHWIEQLSVNLGRGRVVPFRPRDGKVKFHRSVKIREEAPEDLVQWVDKKQRRYKPVATWNEGVQIEYVA